MTEPFTLDVRDRLRSRGEPRSQILQAVGRLAPGQPMRLLATFEPLPLYAVLGRARASIAAPFATAKRTGR